MLLSIDGGYGQFKLCCVYVLIIVLEGIRKRKGNATKSEDHQRTQRIVTVNVEALKRIETDTKDVQKTVAFSPDARLLATGGTDGHLRIWKVSIMIKFVPNWARVVDV